MEPKINGLKPVWDEQIKTPKHDEMCIYLLDSKNIINIINKIQKFKEFIKNVQKNNEDYYSKQIKPYQIKCESEWKTISVEKQTTSNTNIYPYKIIGYWETTQIIGQVTSLDWEIETQTILEYPVKSNNFLIGVIDAKIIIYGTLNKTEKRTTNKFISLEKKLDSLSQYNYSRREESFEQDNKITNENILQTKEKIILLELFVEVKPNIISIGETLRQLNTYQSYLHSRKNTFLLFTTKKETKQIFESQEYSFISLEELEPIQKQLTDGEFQ